MPARSATSIRAWGPPDHGDGLARREDQADPLRAEVSVWSDGSERRAEAFRVVGYPTPPGSAAAYYPETNVLVPLDSVAGISNTPTSKSVIVRLEPAARSPQRGRR